MSLDELRPGWEWTVDHEDGELYGVRRGPTAGGVTTAQDDDGPPLVLVDGYGDEGGQGLTLTTREARRLAADLGAVLHRLGPEF